MRICFFGDSFVNGTGDPDCLGWAGRLCVAARRQGCDLTYYNLGIRRDTSKDIERRWYREASLRLPSDVDGRLVFSFGANDCVDAPPRISPEHTLANTKKIIEMASGWKPTLMVGPPPIADAEINRRIGSLSAALAAKCGELGVPYFDAFAPLSAADLWRREVASGDGAHPGADGYALFAELIGRWPSWQAWVARVTS